MRDRRCLSPISREIRVYSIEATLAEFVLPLTFHSDTSYLNKQYTSST